MTYWEHTAVTLLCKSIEIITTELAQFSWSPCLSIWCQLTTTLIGPLHAVQILCLSTGTKVKIDNTDQYRVLFVGSGEGLLMSKLQNVQIWNARTKWSTCSSILWPAKVYCDCSFCLFQMLLVMLAKLLIKFAY